MSFLVSLKVVRWLLAISVSIWLAGGCLFGCGNMTMAAEVSTEAESCHAVSPQASRSHDCCAQPKPKQVEQRKVNIQLNETFARISSVPRGGITECPMMMGATAVVSKNSSNSPDLAGATTATVPVAVSDAGLPQRHIVDPFLPNRGPTYLCCCVFLI
jgi:hypothetical protein